MPEFIEVPGLVREPLVLPIRGGDGVLRKYEVKPSSGRDYIVMSIFKSQTLGAPLTEPDRVKIQHLDSISQVWALALGPELLDRVLDDGVSADDMKRMSQTAFYWQTADGDTELAEVAWSGKAQDLTTNGPTLYVRDGDEASTTPGQTSGSPTTIPPTGSPEDQDDGLSSGPGVTSGTT